MSKGRVNYGAGQGSVNPNAGYAAAVIGKKDLRELRKRERREARSLEEQSAALAKEREGSAEHARRARKAAETQRQLQGTRGAIRDLEARLLKAAWK